MPYIAFRIGNLPSVDSESELEVISRCKDCCCLPLPMMLRAQKTNSMESEYSLIEQLRPFADTIYLQATYSTKIYIDFDIPQASALINSYGSKQLLLHSEYIHPYICIRCAFIHLHETDPKNHHQRGSYLKKTKQLNIFSLWLERLLSPSEQPAWQQFLRSTLTQVFTMSPDLLFFSTDLESNSRLKMKQGRKMSPHLKMPDLQDSLQYSTTFVSLLQAYINLCIMAFLLLLLFQCRVRNILLPWLSPSGISTHLWCFFSYLNPHKTVIVLHIEANKNTFSLHQC